MTRRFETAVVTGGARGLGAALVDRLRAHGARVVVSDVREEALEAFVSARTADGGPPLLGIAADVSDVEQVEALARRAVTWLGAVDLWVNNAGVAAAGRCEETSEATWRRVVEIDLMGVVWGCRAILPHFQQRREGALLNVSSAAGLVCGPEMAAYNVAKAGVVGLSQSLATELTGSDITVTCLCPTFFASGLLQTAEGDPGLLRMADKLMQRSRWTADQVAGQALNDALRGRFFSVPMADGRWVWRLRRLFPERSGRWIGRVFYRGRARSRRGHAQAVAGLTDT